MIPVLQAGQLVDNRYKVLNVIGKGAMGAVYLVEDTLINGKKWALKELFATGDQKDIERFQREAQILANLDHSNLPKVDNYFDDRGNFYLVMDYIEGENLGQLLTKNPSGLPEKDAWKWLNTILEILEFLHSQNPIIIFRDIKPDNMILDPSGKLYLVDAGIAVRKQQGQAIVSTSGQTAQTSPLATPETAAPEQDKYCDEKSDIYNLGASMFWLLTGQAPRWKIPVQDINRLRPDLSPELCDIICKMTKYHPEERPQSIQEVLRLIPGSKLKTPISGLLPTEASDIETFYQPDIGNSDTIFITCFKPDYDRIIGYLNCNLSLQALPIINKCIKRLVGWKKFFHFPSPLKKICDVFEFLFLRNIYFVFSDDVVIEKTRTIEHLKILYNCKIRLLHSIGDFAQVENTIKDYIKNIPDADLLLLAEFYETQDEWTKAKSCYEKVIKKDPKRQIAYLKVGELSGKIKKMKLAQAQQMQTQAVSKQQIII